ncbi:MAG: glycine cleavage system protein GcvH [Pseudonocardiaceae bacterium]
MVVPEKPRYSEDHEWVLASGAGVVRVGITAYAQKQLGEIVFIELPQVGDSVAQGDEVGTVESVKAVSEVYAPVAGELVARNDALNDSPELVNEDPYGEGWMFEIKLADASALDSLLSAADYRTFIAEGT